MQINNYFDTSAGLAYCKGCGHPLILKKIGEAFSELNLAPEEIVIVTDIGCVGLADKYFKTHTVHTLHGRSAAISAGIQLSKNIKDKKNLKIIVLIGDGGTTIGLLHLVECARMNIDIKVLVHNNFLYGMTGGQHSGLTPRGFITRTTKYGNPFFPMDICSIIEKSGAGFIARTFAQSSDLKEIIKSAILYKGFSLIEIIEICTGYALKYNELNLKKLMEIVEKQGLKTGIIKCEESHPYTAEKASCLKGDFFEDKIEVKFKSSLKDKLSIIIGGSAGEGVQSSAGLFCLAGISAGLSATQKNDYPITVGSGYSVSEIIFSKEEINYTGIESPDFVILTSKQGYERLKKLTSKIKKGKIICDESLDIKNSNVNIIKRAFRKFKESPNLSALAFLLKEKPFIPVSSLIYILREKNKKELEEIVMRSYNDKFP